MARKGLYSEYAAWHCHCGPKWTAIGVQPTDWNLTANFHGRQSSEVIHYSIKAVQPAPERAVTIVGFSREHVPFPQPHDRGNPLIARLMDLKNAV